jgi:hypothetical protein
MMMVPHKHMEYHLEDFQGINGVPVTFARVSIPPLQRRVCVTACGL